MRLVATLGVLVAVTAHAQSLGVVVMDAQGLPDASVRRLHKAATEGLKQLSALPVGEGLEWKGPKKSCPKDDLGCQRDKVKAAQAPGVLALWVKGNSDGLTLDAVFWLDGERASSTRQAPADLDALADGLRPLLESTLPGWMRKGWGGLRLAEEPPAGSVLKLDGRVLGKTKSDVVSVTAGPHQLDVLLPDGSSVLQRVEVQEGSRTRVEVLRPELTPTVTSKASSFSTLRAASYALWMVGSATLLSAFIVGFVGRQTANGQSPCTLTTRECVTYEMASEQQRKAAGYASIATALLVTGLVVSVAGAGLFTFDVL